MKLPATKVETTRRSLLKGAGSLWNLFCFFFGVRAGPWVGNKSGGTAIYTMGEYEGEWAGAPGPAGPGECHTKNLNFHVLIDTSQLGFICALKVISKKDVIANDAK